MGKVEIPIRSRSAAASEEGRPQELPSSWPSTEFLKIGNARHYLGFIHRRTSALAEQFRKLQCPHDCMGIGQNSPFPSYQSSAS